MVFDCIKKFNKLDVEICEVYSSQSFDRVVINLEKSGNLKETSASESQGICDRIPKVRESQGICDRIPKVREVREFFV